MNQFEPTGKENDAISPRLELNGISVRFGATQALKDVSFSVRPSEVHALIGENGAGKSTLMKVLSGALCPDEGVIKIDSQQRSFAGPMDARAAGVAMIYQELSLAPELNAVQNIYLGMELRKNGLLDKAAMHAAARQALVELEHELRLDVPVKNLSISDQQIIEIARASALGSRILILDEPTSSLTQKDVDKLFRLIRRLREKGHSIIYISHFLEEIQQITDRFTVLRDGQTVGGGTTSEFNPEQIVSLMLGRDLKDLYPRSEHKAAEPLLEVRQLADYGRLQNASFSLHRGEVFGIFGLVGSGRTELLRAIFGLEKVKSGEVALAAVGQAKVAGQTKTSGLRWDQGVGMLAEDRKNEGLAISMSIADNLILSHPQPFEKNGLLFPGPKFAAVKEWIEKMSIKCQGPAQKVSDLSGGNQQKIAIARLLHHKVDVLLLDEPTRGIDLGSKSQIYKLIDQLAQEGKAILIVSSYLPELMGICDRIAVMCRGVLLAPRPIAEVTENSIMVQATTGAGATEA
jgi:ribose transport system ATP-binding protein